MARRIVIDRNKPAPEVAHPQVPPSTPLSVGVDIARTPDTTEMFSIDSESGSLTRNTPTFSSGINEAMRGLQNALSAMPFPVAGRDGFSTTISATPNHTRVALPLSGLGSGTVRDMGIEVPIVKLVSVHADYDIATLTMVLVFSFRAGTQGTEVAIRVPREVLMEGDTEDVYAIISNSLYSHLSDVIHEAYDEMVGQLAAAMVRRR